MNIDLLGGKKANPMWTLVSSCFCIFLFAFLFGSRFPETNGWVIPGPEGAVNREGEKTTVACPT